MLVLRTPPGIRNHKLSACRPVLYARLHYHGGLPIIAGRRLSLGRVNLGLVRESVCGWRHEGVREAYQTEGARAWHGYTDHFCHRLIEKSGWVWWFARSGAAVTSPITYRTDVARDRVGLVFFEDTCRRCDSLVLDKYIFLIRLSEKALVDVATSESGHTPSVFTDGLVSPHWPILLPSD